jgi:hypothetical protein
VIIKRFEASSQFSPADNAWICYRQNQFKIICYYPRSPDISNLVVVDNNELVPVTQLFAKLCAIKENIGRTPFNQVAYVGIQHVGKKRTKKDKSDLSPIPFISGMIKIYMASTLNMLYPVFAKCIYSFYLHACRQSRVYKHAI